MRNKKGFSIGEVMVAMFILLVGIVDAVFLTVRSIDNMKGSRDAVIATLLAQEGVELVRNVRDNNVTQETCGTGTERCTAFDPESDYNWPSYNVSTFTSCTIDYATSGASSRLVCSGVSPDDKLYLNTETGMYSHSGGGTLYEDSHLRRRIYIQYSKTNVDPPNDVLAKVTSVVIFGGQNNFPSADNVERDCKISQNCVFAQTRLTSWINYGD